MFELEFTAEEEAFRAELRAWLAAHLPPGWGDGQGKLAELPAPETERLEFLRRWQRTLAADRWVGIHWSLEHGGRGASLEEQIIYTEEMARARAPGILDPVAVNIVGPTLIAFGTAEQKRQYLPRILPAADVWCLGFSEPGAGSDLASLRCAAVRDGDAFVVTGQKVWSSRAHVADRCLLLVRTSSHGPKHAGISLLAVDMKAPGVSWRPLVQMSGRSDFGELFFDEVRVPVTSLVGAENDGWRIVRTALGHERGTLWAFEFKIRLQNGARALVDLYRRCRRGQGGRAGDVPAMRQRVAQAYIDAQVFAAHTLRMLPRLHGATDAPPEAALQKLFGSEIDQRNHELAMALAGPYAQLGRDPRRAIDGGAWYEAYLYSRSFTISSGTSEILRTLLAQRALGLPRG